MYTAYQEKCHFKANPIIFFLQNIEKRHLIKRHIIVQNFIGR